MELSTPQSFRFKAGDSVRFTLDVVNEAGAAADISGMTPRFVAARKVGSTAVLSTEAPLANVTATVSDGPNGEIEITIDAAITDPLSGSYAYECELEDSNDGNETIAYGYLSFSPNLL